MATSFIDYAINSSAVFKLTFVAGTQEHAATSVFLISNVTGYHDASNATLAEIMTHYWISFALTHGPNPMRSNSAPFWPSYSARGNGTVAEGVSVGFSVLGITAASIGRCQREM